jgi:hypothetical protein
MTNHASERSSFVPDEMPLFVTGEVPLLQL